MSKQKRNLTSLDHSGGGGEQDSQCYFVQLQIDSFLDGDLSATQQDAFMEHVAGCKACSSEFQFARVVHDTVLDLPMLDCPDSALEPVDRLGGRAAAPTSAWWHDVVDWFNHMPLAIRYALPAIFAVAATLLVVPELDRSAPDEMLAELPVVPEPEYTQADVLAALADLNTAITYLNEVSQRTESMIGGRFVVMPLQDSLNASFERLQDDENDPLSDDPI